MECTIRKQLEHVYLTSEEILDKLVVSTNDEIALEMIQYLTRDLLGHNTSTALIFIQKASSEYSYQDIDIYHSYYHEHLYLFQFIERFYQSI
jgi:hypothetical protein